MQTEKIVNQQNQLLTELPHATLEEPAKQSALIRPWHP